MPLTIQIKFHFESVRGSSFSRSIPFHFETHFFSVAFLHIFFFTSIVKLIRKGMKYEVNEANDEKQSKV